MSCRIEPAPPSSAVALSLLHRACFPEDPWDAAALSRLFALSGCRAWVAWQGETLTGFALARDLGDECEILSLGVLPEWRRHGIARELMRGVAGEARHRHFRSVVLEVAQDNEAAYRLYSGLGFTKVGQRPRYYRRADGLADALILRLMLVEKPTLA
jgi:ribosomal-protein-alanine N-acetyltransferase